MTEAANHTALKGSARRVQEGLRARGLELEVRELPKSARSAAEAAAALHCDVAQIAKSLVFRLESGGAVLVVASGANRVDLDRLTAHLGEPVHKPGADFVREATGYAIGGVPPAFHSAPLLTLVDEDLLVYSTIWAAAGTPNAVFALSPDALLALTDGAPLKLAAKVA